MFLPRGGKPILERLAKNIIENDTANTIVAMDSDYDELLGDYIVDARVLYTRGYSWENDLFDGSFLLDILKAVSHRAAIPVASRTTLTSGLAGFQREAYWPIEL